MVVENIQIKRICSFYVSEFHLGMILLPYISQKIERKEPILIVSEKNLLNSIKELVSKVNLKEEIKNQILNLKWNCSNIVEIKDKSNIILIGKEKFIEDKVKEIEEKNINEIQIIDCYYFEEIKNKMQDIVEKHDRSLNTLGISAF